MSQPPNGEINKQKSNPPNMQTQFQRQHTAATINTFPLMNWDFYKEQQVWRAAIAVLAIFLNIILQNHKISKVFLKIPFHLKHCSSICSTGKQDTRVCMYTHTHTSYSKIKHSFSLKRGSWSTPDFCFLKVENGWSLVQTRPHMDAIFTY